MDSTTKQTNESKAMKESRARAEEKKLSKPGTMSLAQALRMVEAGMSASAIVAQSPTVGRSAAKPSSESKKDHSQFEGVMDVPLVPKGAAIVSFGQLIQGRPSEDLLRAMFAGKRGFEPAVSILRDPLDPHFKKGGGKENICTVVHATQMVSHAPDCYMRIAQGSEEKMTPAEMQECREWCKKASRFMVANGPMGSCFKRLISAASSARPTGRKYLDPETVAAVKSMLPYKKENVREMKGMMPGEFEWLTLNLNSSAGFPWDKPKKEVLKEAYDACAQLFNAIRDGSAAKLLEKHPQWLLVKLMNKLDRYDMDELQGDPASGVVRQYFVYPFHWVILFSALNQNVSQSMVGFWEDSKSFSAHGFAWQNGGPQKIIDWIRAQVAKGPGVYGIAYSDDQLWVLVTKDGKVHILCPDIKRMDLNLVSAVGRLYHIYGKEVLGDHIDESWLAVSKLHCKMAFDCAVIMEYAMVFQTTEFLHSGVPGTPEFDQVASAAGFHYIKKIMGEPADLNEAKKRLEEGWAFWKTHFGLSVKPFEFYEATAELKDPEADFVTKWAFLGKHLMYQSSVRGWLPRSDPVRCIASILAPKARQVGNSGLRSQMQRVRQIVAAGGFTIKQVYEMTRSWYATMRSMDNTPANPLEPSDAELIDTALDPELAMVFNGPEFPSELECANVYLPHGKKVNLSGSVPMIGDEAAVLGTNVTSAKSMVDSLFTDTFAETGVWADSAEPPQAVVADKGATNIAPIPTTTMDRVGRARPKTDEERKLYEDARKLKYLERIAEIGRNVHQAISKGAAPLLKGRKLIGEKGIAYAQKLAEDHNEHVDEYAPYGGSTYKGQFPNHAPYERTPEAYQNVREELADYDDQALSDDFYRKLEDEYYNDLNNEAVRRAHKLHKEFNEY